MLRVLQNLLKAMREFGAFIVVGVHDDASYYKVYHATAAHEHSVSHKDHHPAEKETHRTQHTAASRECQAICRHGET